MRRPLFTTVPALLCLTLLCTAASEAAERQRSGGFSTSRGHSGTYQTTVSSQRGAGLNRQQTVTGADGKTVTRSSIRQYDPVSGQFNRSTTAANGDTRTVQGTRTDGQNSGTYTGANGNTGTFNQQTSRTDGTANRQTEVTTAAGKNLSRDASYSYDQVSNTLNRSVTGSQGNTRSGSITVTPTP